MRATWRIVGGIMTHLRFYVDDADIRHFVGRNEAAVRALIEQAIEQAIAAKKATIAAKKRTDPRERIAALNKRAWQLVIRPGTVGAVRWAAVIDTNRYGLLHAYVVQDMLVATNGHLLVTARLPFTTAGIEGYALSPDVPNERRIADLTPADFMPTDEEHPPIMAVLAPARRQVVPLAAPFTRDDIPEPTRNDTGALHVPAFGTWFNPAYLERAVRTLGGRVDRVTYAGHILSPHVLTSTLVPGAEVLLMPMRAD